MNRPRRDGTAEPVSRDQILRRARGQGNIHFPFSADHEQDWQPYPVDPYSAICDDIYIYIYTYTQEKGHTGFLHLPSAVLALIFIARRIQLSISLVDREVELCVPTN